MASATERLLQQTVIEKLSQMAASASQEDNEFEGFKQRVTNVTNYLAKNPHLFTPTSPEAPSILITLGQVREALIKDRELVRLSVTAGVSVEQILNRRTIGPKTLKETADCHLLDTATAYIDGKTLPFDPTGDTRLEICRINEALFADKLRFLIGPNGGFENCLKQIQLTQDRLNGRCVCVLQ
ncbi:MAG TPA: hypothetical protein VLF94_04225 [Chlamydiales bacterium]|nr:hypothetical protein [Chlamydiales bacterium]